MSWNEPFIQKARADFLTESAVFSHCQVIEPSDEALNKHWLIVSNIQHGGLSPVRPSIVLIVLPLQTRILQVVEKKMELIILKLQQNTRENWPST